MTPRILADDLVELMTRTGRAPLMPVRVAGPVDLTGQVFGRKISFNEVIFEDGVDLSAAHFGGGVKFIRCSFAGNLVADALRSGSDFTVLDCDFVTGDYATDRTLKLRDADIFGDLELGQIRGCGGISAANTEVRGHLRLAGITVDRPTLSSESSREQVEALNLSHMSVGADATVGFVFGHEALESLNFRRPAQTRVALAGSVQWSGMTVQGSLFLQDLVVCSPAALAEIAETGKKRAESREKAKAEDPEWSAPRIDLHREFRGQPPFLADQLSCASLFVTGSALLGDASLINSRIGGLIRVQRGAPQNEQLPLRAIDISDLPDIGGNLRLEGAEIASQVDMEMTVVSGALVMNGTKCGSLVLDGSASDNLHFGGVYIVDSVFRSYARFIGARIGLSRQAALPPPPGGERSLRGLKVQNSRFENGLSFWTSASRQEYVSEATGIGYHEHQAWSPACRFTEIGGEVSLVNCDITGDVDLTRLRVFPYRGEAEAGEKDGQVQKGGVVLDRSTITGSLLFRSPHSTALDPGTEPALRHAARAWLARFGKSTGDGTAAPEWRDTRAEARFLQMRRTTVRGDVDLTGLDIGENSNASGDPATTDDMQGGHRAGSVHAERLCVGGEMVCMARYTPDDGEDCAAPVAHLCVPGALRLDDADISELQITRHSFPLDHQVPPPYRRWHGVLGAIGLGPLAKWGSDRPRAEDIGVVLEEARVGHLKIPRDPGCKDSGRGFPLPISLSGFVTDRWSFGREGLHGAVAERQLARDHVDVLNNDETLNRDIYQRAYRILKNNGLEYAAGQVYRAEHARAYSERVANSQTLSGRWWRWCLARVAVLTQPWRTLTRVAAALPMVIVFPLLLLWDSLWAVLREFLHWSYALFLEHGRSPARLGYLIVGLFLMSWLVVGNERTNFELSAQSREVLAGSQAVDPALALGIDYETGARTLHPDPEGWNLWSGFWLTVRSHVPLVSLAARTDFEPSDDVGLACAEGFWERICTDAERRSRMTPEDWFTLMSLANWVLWPIFLTFALRRAFRDNL